MPYRYGKMKDSFLKLPKLMLWGGFCLFFVFLERIYFPWCCQNKAEKYEGRKPSGQFTAKQMNLHEVIKSNRANNQSITRFLL